MKEIYIVKLDETMISKVGYQTIEQAQNFIKSRIENDTHTVEDWNSPLAVNIDDLQCDYGFDWHEPCVKETGDIWITDQAVTKDDDVDWVNEEAKEIKEAFERGELEVE